MAVFNQKLSVTKIVDGINNEVAAQGAVKSVLMECLKAGKKGIEAIIEAATALAGVDSEGKVVASTDGIKALRTALRRASTAIDESKPLTIKALKDGGWHVGPATGQINPTKLDEQWADKKAQAFAKAVSEPLKGKRNKKALLLTLIADTAYYLELDPQELTDTLEALYAEVVEEEEGEEQATG